MTDVTIARDHLDIDGVRYPRDRTGKLELGSFGWRRESAGDGLTYVDIAGHLHCRYLHDDVLSVSTSPLDWSAQRREDVDAAGGVLYFRLGSSTAVAGTLAELAAADVALVKVEFTEATVKHLLNEQDDDAREFLATGGDDARLVTTMWTLMEPRLAEYLAAETTYDVDGAADRSGLEVGVPEGVHGAQSVIFSSGVVLAFSMHAVTQWDRSAGDRITEIAEDRGVG